MELCCPRQHISTIRLYCGTSCAHSRAFILIGSSSFFAGNEDDHKVSDEFEIQPDSIMDCGVSCLERLEECPKVREKQ